MNYKDYIITALSYLRQQKKRRLIKTAYQLKSKEGIEIGGPSKLFGLRGAFPIYLFAKKIDGVNFSNETVWEGNIKQGETYHYFANKLGYQYIAEATDLQSIPANQYDFLLSCHSLEHVANPIKALMEWNRVIKTGGKLILVLPDKRYTFDIKRPYTTLQHLVDDYKANTDENDATHFEEIIKYHDRSRDPGMKTEMELEQILKNNFQNRTAHHHVFSQEVVKQMLNYCGFNVTYQQETNPFNLITVAMKQ